MTKHITFTLLFLSVLSCTEKSNDPKKLSSDSPLIKYDSDGDGFVSDLEIEIAAEKETQDLVDSLTNFHHNNYYVEKQSKSDKESNIEIRGISFPSANEYSNYDAIEFSYKNNTGKDIAAISFSWYDLKDVFGESINPTYTGGYSESTLRQGKTGYGSWDLLEKKVKSGKVFVSKIAFKDGTVWKNE